MSNDRNAFGIPLTPEEYSATPLPGSKPVKVSREVPVTIISKGDGTKEVVQTDTAEPCYACKCCVLWVANIETLRTSICEHEDGEHGGQIEEGTAAGSPSVLAELFPGCLVCQLLAGAADG